MIYATPWQPNIGFLGFVVFAYIVMAVLPDVERYLARRADKPAKVIPFPRRREPGEAA